jgi:hypothetical protein
VVARAWYGLGREGEGVQTQTERIATAGPIARESRSLISLEEPGPSGDAGYAVGERSSVPRDS